MIHSFETDTAEKYGINAAIVLNLMRGWIAYNKANKKNERDGRTWTYNSVKSWSQLMPYLTGKQIRKAIDDLVGAGAVIKCNFNENRYDHTLWYALAEEVGPICLPGQHEMTSGAPHVAPEGETLDQGIKPEIKPSQPAPPAKGEEKNNALTLEAVKFVDWFLELLTKTGAKVPHMTPGIRIAWADSYEKLVRIDGRKKEEIVQVCRWARRDSFWASNFLSPAKLRQKNNDQVLYYDVFLNKLAAKGSSSGSSGSRSFEHAGDLSSVTDK